jgi:hypothetical protein
MFNFINECLGLSEASFFVNIEGGRPKIVGDNLVKCSGIFAAAFSKVTVDFLNFYSHDDCFWGTLCINFTTHTGESNGVYFAAVSYNVVDGWKFKKAVDLKKF